MPDKILITLLFSLFLMTGGGSAYAQIPPQDIQEDTETDEAELIKITPDTDETEPLPEVPSQTIHIALKDDRLSVDLVNVTFGDIIQEIAQKAAFSIEGYSSVFSKTITTKFNDLEIDRGIIRLFSLVKEKNYLINYDTKGAILKLEIYGAETAGSVPKTPARPQVFSPRQQVSPPSPAAPPRPAIPGIFPSGRRTAPRTPQVSPQYSPPGQISEDQDIEDEDLPEEDVKEIPYIPPQRKPVYIPPLKR